LPSPGNGKNIEFDSANGSFELFYRFYSGFYSVPSFSANSEQWIVSGLIYSFGQALGLSE
jgi:hypothetical protein